MTDLKALVERIEGASEGSWALDWAIHLRDGLDGKGMYGSHPYYTASLDAAMQLVPEGCFWALNMAGDGSGFDAMCQDDGPVKWTRAATPALALCAASLRARISKGTHP